jgi:hypothetical protein
VIGVGNGEIYPGLLNIMACGLSVEWAGVAGDGGGAAKKTKQLFDRICSFQINLYAYVVSGSVINQTKL